MFKQRKVPMLSLVVGASALSLAAGAGVAVLLLTNRGNQGSSQPMAFPLPTTPSIASNRAAEIAPLVTLAPKQRVPKLEAIAHKAQPVELSRRARYLLARDLIQQKQGQKALTWLQGLEQDYPVLAAQIAVKRAQAHEVSGESAKAKAVWQEVVQRYPKNPAVVEALIALGKHQPQYWEQAIAQFPGHPRTIKMVQERLKRNPKQPKLMLVMAKHAFYAPGITTILDQLSTRYTAQLTPEDWAAIGFAYWENMEYGKGASAYAKAPNTPLNLYRSARGLHLSGQGGQAIPIYETLVQAFPKEKETGLALLRLAQLAATPQAAIAYLDIVIQTFPDRAPEALLDKADQLEQLNSAKSASEVRKLLLSKYADSDAAAEMRWQTAQGFAKQGDYLRAWQWAQPIAQSAPDSDVAPEAAFWVGKWAQRLGRSQDAKAAFEYTLTTYPASYYAWRSAAMLGLNVGDFTTVRDLNPKVERPVERPSLPVGSEALQELYQLGEDQDSWALWRVEFKNPQQPTVAEQFTDGLMRLSVGDNLDGMYMVSSLSDRTDPKEKAEYKVLKQQDTYWQALYPFPFLPEIENWSQQRQLNPLLVTGLIRQESRFEPKIKSVAGATGLMQVMPDTGVWIAEKIKLKQYSLENPEDNIKLGTWYLDYTHEEYGNNSLLAVASYNAGPGNVADWVKKKGLRDPDEFVEAIPFDETRGYVKHVFENYWNYLRLYSPDIAQLLAKYESDRPAPPSSKS